MTFDPWAQLADMQKWMSENFPSYKSAVSGSPMRYEAMDPAVYEIAILAAMHNMASMLQDSQTLKSAIGAAIKERAERLRA